jgi:hypothetical protein
VVQERQLRLDGNLAQTLLGYLNFSDGRPDARWQKALNEAYIQLAVGPTPWKELLAQLRRILGDLQSGGSAAFRDIHQAAGVLDCCAEVLPAYRAYHADLLAHLDEADLFGPFFLARVLEAILQLRHQLEELPSVAAVITRINDFVGHRPVALLETRPQGEPYDHERHRPLPLYLRGPGTAHSRYRAVLDQTLDILRNTDPALLSEACLHLDSLEEIALDLRAYDHGHPVNRRPNYVFGEYDPHQIDNKGRYTRYVIRKVTLDALMERVEGDTPSDPGERLLEGAAVLAGTILMATGVCGWGPGAHDSTSTLATLLPRIARYRDAFYEQLIRRLTGKHADRLRQEKEATRQAFGAARQHLNAYLARHRATQLQQRFLALLFAEMGYPRASQSEANRIQAVSVRLLSRLLGEIASGLTECELGRFRQAAERLPRIEELLHRGIHCGALADPWNILGFQGLFPLSPAREDAIRDSRLEELLTVVEQIFSYYARLMSESAAVGQRELVEQLGSSMEKLANWWDRFATFEVSDLRRVHGGEAVQSARSVAAALAGWRERGEATQDLAFWRDRLSDFRSPRAFALVVEALLARNAHRAALGLLASWLGNVAQVPLEDGSHSFHNLALRWMLTLTRPGVRLADSESRAIRELVGRFFDYLEANAEDYWEVPSLESKRSVDEDNDDSEDTFGAAYEGMIYRDSTDSKEGAVSDGAPRDHFDLEEQHEQLEQRLRFLSTLARLWQIAVRFVGGGEESPAGDWLVIARRNWQRLLELLDALQDHVVPEPTGDHDSLIEFDRRRVIKEQLIYATIGTSLDTALAIGSLRGALGLERGSHDPDAPPWEQDAIRLERALFAGDADGARRQLTSFVGNFRNESLLFTPLSQGQESGQPRAILRVRIAQSVLRALLSSLPRLGLLRETYELLRTARQMEQSQPKHGRGITEFNHFFQAAYQAVIENVVRSSLEWPADQASDDRVVELLERLTSPFLSLWIEHSQTLQLSVLENVHTEAEWRALSNFVQRYGRDLFHVRFMTLGNLRGILHRGVSSYLDYLRDNPDPLRPIRLIEELDGAIDRETAVRWLQLVLQAVIENYEEYKDYNTTTTQSDYGENLHVLLDFLRLKAQYERHAWQFRPLIMGHEVLARHGRGSTALRWEESLVQITRDLANQHLEKLARLERQHGVRLNTIADRLKERFVKQLRLDRLCALIEPCLQQARERSEEEERPAFGRLLSELRAYATTPTGVGLDVPAWLRRLEAEVHRVQASHTAVAVLAENFFRVPQRTMSLEEVQRLLRDWERPALPF